MAAISLFNSPTPRPLTFDLMRQARREAFKNAGGRGDPEDPLNDGPAQPTVIVTTAEQQQRYASMFGTKRPLAFDGIEIIADDTLEPGTMQFLQGDRVLAEIRDLA